MMAPAPQLVAVLSGRIDPAFSREPSAIAKRPIDRAVAVTAQGLAGDEQADPAHHGGPDKALHHYAYDHYPAWAAELGPHPLLTAPGAFGENIATTGLDETTVLLGDRFRLGTALVEVSHGRQPCWKLDHRLGVRGLSGQIVRNGRCGWYYRVVEPGLLGPGDGITLVERGLEAWPIARLFASVIGGKGAPHEWRELARLAVLAEVWRARAVQLAG